MLKILLVSSAAIILIATGIWNLATHSGWENESDFPRPVESVKLQRYTGTWYEIARKPNEFQTDCWGDVIVNYTLRDDGKIGVLNQCRKDTANGRIKYAEGKARVVDKKTNSKLQVNFAPGFLDFLPFVWGDYWILELGENYEYAVVGDPKRRYLWILSRETEMNDKTYRELLKRIDAQGYNSTEVIRSKHSELKK